MAVAKRRYLDILLGIFVAGGIALLAVFIFLIGKERRLFDVAAHVHTYFPNVAGLNVGAEVLLAGVVVGHVKEISFPPLETKDPRIARQIKVLLRVSKDMLQWIRADSVARIDSKGLLGDKTINISLGSAQVAAVPDGGVLQSIAPLDFNEALSKAQTVLENITETVVGARKFIEGFTAKGGDVAIADAANSLKNIMREVEKGDGIVHSLIYNKAAGKDFRNAIGNLNETVASIKKTAGHVDGILYELEKGGGLLHALIYDRAGGEIAKQADEMLRDINAVLKEIRSGSGILHSLIYDSQQGNLVKDLNLAAADLRAIIASVKGGQGTLGRLLIDPTVYDDLKQILSQVKRNEILKALVRFSISKRDNEAAQPPPVTEPPQ